MAVPTFDALMLPMLRLCGDGTARTRAEMQSGLARSLALPDSDRQEPLASGQPKFANRVNWAAIYLTKAGLLTRPRRGHYAITDLGRAALAGASDRITVAQLRAYPEFEAFWSRTGQTGTPRPGGTEGESPGTAVSPQESLDSAYRTLRAALESDLLDRLRTGSPYFFERVVVDVLLAMGYGGSRVEAGEVTKASGDGGIDGIIKEDRLGLDVVYLQAKRWASSVGSDVVQAFVGALEGKRASKGVLITTSSFTASARAYAGNIGKRVVLIDGDQLASLMVDYNVGVRETARYVVKSADLDYFEEE